MNSTRVTTGATIPVGGGGGRSGAFLVFEAPARPPLEPILALPVVPNAPPARGMVCHHSGIMALSQYTAEIPLYAVHVQDEGMLTRKRAFLNALM